MTNHEHTSGDFREDFELLKEEVLARAEARAINDETCRWPLAGRIDENKDLHAYGIGEFIELPSALTEELRQAIYAHFGAEMPSNEDFSYGRWYDSDSSKRLRSRITTTTDRGGVVIIERRSIKDPNARGAPYYKAVKGTLFNFHVDVVSPATPTVIEKNLDQEQDQLHEILRFPSIEGDPQKRTLIEIAGRAGRMAAIQALKEAQRAEFWAGLIYNRPISDEYQKRFSKYKLMPSTLVGFEREISKNLEEVKFWIDVAQRPDRQYTWHDIENALYYREEAQEKMLILDDVRSGRAS